MSGVDQRGEPAASLDVVEPPAVAGRGISPQPRLLDRRRRAPAPAPERFLAMIGDKLAATEEVFRAHLASDVPFIDHAGDYLATSGGKRMRPALLLLAARLLGHDGDEEVTYAAVVEYIHTATLIHDDVIDHATLRRGRTTVNELWGNSLTVLLGDWLYTNAMRMALSHGNLEVVRALCDATLKMVEGELLALQRLGSIDLTVDEYFGIIERKTAHLFAAACSVPALIPAAPPGLGMAPEAARRALERYGRSLGTCFQLVDDLLDFTASEAELGKPVLSDLKEGKLTLPLILLLPRVSPSERRLVQRVLEDRAFERVSPEQVLDVVEREGTVDEVEEMAHDFAEEARLALEPFAPSDAREALELAPDFVLNRRH
jgi:octaprenyl-diphosphate synthase